MCAVVGLHGVVCALCRYLGRKKCVQSVCVQPPFLRPQLTEAQLAAKILDNGIQGDLHRVRLAGRSGGTKTNRIALAFW